MRTAKVRVVRAWLLAVAVSSAGTIARAQTAQFQLLRCGPTGAAQCLAARMVLPPSAVIGATAGDTSRWSARLGGVAMFGAEQARISGSDQPDITPVFGAPVLPASALARASLQGQITLSSGVNAVLRVPARWRPPLIAQPAFVATADSLAIPLAIREALSAGDEPPPVRPLVAMIMLLTSLVMIAYVPRFAWRESRENDEDMARRIASARALLSTQELEQLRGKAPQEAKPRHPDEPTHQITVLQPPT